MFTKKNKTRHIRRDEDNPAGNRAWMGGKGEKAGKIEDLEKRKGGTRLAAISRDVSLSSKGNGGKTTEILQTEYMKKIRAEAR